jgi:hypothetical protein
MNRREKIKPELNEQQRPKFQSHPRLLWDNHFSLFHSEHLRRRNDLYYLLQVIGSRHINKIVLEVKDKTGYMVVAPIGSSFTCSDLGMFRPAGNETSSYK